jgi:hypothetical protein
MSVGDAMVFVGMALIAAALYAWWGWPAAAVWAGAWLLVFGYGEVQAARRRKGA